MIKKIRGHLWVSLAAAFLSDLEECDVLRVSHPDLRISGWEGAFHFDTHIFNMTTCSGLPKKDSSDNATDLSLSWQKNEESFNTATHQQTVRAWLTESETKLCLAGVKRQNLISSVSLWYVLHAHKWHSLLKPFVFAALAAAKDKKCCHSATMLTYALWL